MTNNCVVCETINYSSMIKLSIIIPIYNVEKYINQCLYSILNDSTQGLPFEVIAVDDGTPDKSMEIVADYQQKFSNLKIITQANQGQGEARNNGIKQAQGEYVWFVDSDDWIGGNAIVKILSEIKSNPEINMFITPAEWVFGKKEKNFIDLQVNSELCCRGIDYLKADYCRVAVWMFIFRKSLMLDNHQYFNKGIKHEDGIWGYKMLYIATRVKLLMKPLYFYRQREDSDMHSITIQSGYDLVKIHRLLNTFMNDFVKAEDIVWFKKWNMLRLEESVSIVWKLHKTEEFRQFLKDTRDYRCKVCDECMPLGGLKWKMKCWLFKHPVLNKRRRLLFDKIKSLVKK